MASSSLIRPAPASAPAWPPTASKPELARDAWLYALRVFDALGHPGAGKVIAKIRSLDMQPELRA